MFLDLKAGDHWGDGPVCQSCKQPIGPKDAAETLDFAGHDDHRLVDMNGIYHSVCAKPFASILRALEALRRMPF